ncbi:Retrovirus-related Pol polyprotein from transposon TNT 1-94 [Apostasia shenzhenica]|uniref:Retrovirus-related Pol polyprotein from transposon TNT 1-94 n=1 Tax=Apostasia shenzhenica TaxID=1088818 RepID=A0A2I0ASJ8_9ASPA|nr:Retrovirus-related Pol polyprotein from transposon TNT 1-94 [Apostasia shenzhenica]
MTYDKELFKELKSTESKKVRIGNGEYIAVKGKGTVAIASCSGTKLITDVLYVPDIDQNLLSVGQLIDKGFKVMFMEKTCVTEDATNQKIFKVKMAGRSFSLNPVQKEQSAFLTKESLSMNPVFHGKTKHFNIKLFFLREVHKEKFVTLLYCKTEDQLADLFTKLLPVSKFEFLRQKLGVRSS